MRSIFLIVCMCCSLITLAQSNFKVSGIVIGVDKEPIIGATIQDKSNQTGVITDVEGPVSYTHLTLPTNSLV